MTIPADSTNARSGEEAEKEIVSLADSLNGHLDRQIDLADRKAQLILAACTFMAATIAPLTARIRFDFLDPSVTSVQKLAAGTTVLMVFALLLCVYFALLVTRPALSNKRQKPSLLYFGHIANLSEQEFLTKFMRQQPEEIRDAILSQVYQKAAIAMRKFAAIRQSLNFLFLTFLFWATVGMLLALVH
ncbi:MAG TPA: hypothetical protein DGH68_07485 [Bacteroidetes bacterium]|nr:hypothetical protein [Bacteroidota bacterium]